MDPASLIQQLRLQTLSEYSLSCLSQESPEWELADSAPRHVRTDGCLDEQAPGVSGLTHMSNVGGEGRQWAGYTDRKSNRFLYFYFFYNSFGRS